MVLNKGGYVMINKAQDNVYELATSALTSGKPILWYESNTECYFIDTITLSGTDIILTKGGKTITIESDGDITESGDVQNPTLETIVDKDGHNRFIELEGNINVVSGVSITYNKCSLSGTHLMFVLAGNIDSGVTLGDDNINIVYDLPNWIKEKIVPITTGSGRVSFKNDIMVNENWTDTQNINTGIYKDISNNIVLFNLATTTTTEKMYFRFQFDLIIDNE